MTFFIPRLEEGLSTEWTLIAGTQPRGTVKEQVHRMLNSFERLDPAFFTGVQCYYVMSIAGIQNSGKSTLLNAVFNTRFPVSYRIESKGVKGFFRRSGSRLYLILDTEGSNSHAEMATEARLFEAGPSAEATIIRFLSLVSNVIILNAFGYAIEHEVGFQANLRAYLMSLLDREDLPATRPIIIVVLRDLDVEDRDRARMPDILDRYATIVGTLKAEVSTGRADALNRMNYIEIRLVSLPHPETHHKRNATYHNELAREQAARKQFEDVARREITEIMNRSLPAPTPWLTPLAHAHAMQTSLELAHRASPVSTNPLLDAQISKMQTELEFCLRPAQINRSIDSVFGVTDADQLWAAITTTNCTMDDAHAAVNQFIMEAFKTRAGVPTSTSAQTGLQDLLKTYEERIDTTSEVYLAQFYSRALQQGNECALVVIESANNDVTEFLTALQGLNLRDLDQKIKTGCNISGYETEDLFLARASWEMAAEWLINDIRSRLVLYQRNDLRLSVDVSKSGRAVHARLQWGLGQTYDAQSTLFQSVLDGVETCARLSSTISQVGSGLGLTAGVLATFPTAAILSLPLAGVAVWKPETVRLAHQWCSGVATSVGRGARSLTYTVGSRCGLLKEVVLVPR